MKRLLKFTIILFAFAAACSSGAPVEQEILQESGRIPLLDTVADTSLGGVSDYLVTSSGVLYLADNRNRHLIILNEDRTLRRIVGRAGQGPGEFQYPYRMALVSDTLRVWDRIGGRLQCFSADGEFLSMIRPNPGISGIRFLAMGHDGRLLLCTYGIGSEYALRIYDRGLDSITELGTLEAPSTSVLHMGLSKSDARSRTIPDGLRNHAFAILSSEGEIFLIHTAIPVFKKYSSSGEELWRTEQDLPQLQVIRNVTFERTLQETGSQVFNPNFWRGGVSDGDGGCYLQLRNTEQIVLFHLKSDGSLGEPIEGPEGSWSVFRRFNGQLWFFNRDSFELIQFQTGVGGK